MTQEHLKRCFNNLELQIVGMWLAGPHCTVLLWHAEPAKLLLEALQMPAILKDRQLENDHLEVARLLVQAEADVNKSTSDDGTAPLYMAAQEGYVEVVHFLIEAGADIDITRKAGAGGVTASYIAAEYGHLEVVRLPVQAGADVDKTTDDGATPLHLAVENGHLEVVRLLIVARANVDKATTDDGTTPMHVAAEKGHLEVARLLIVAG